MSNAWETRAVCNPAVLYHDGEVHLLYRAMGGDDRSTLGHIASAVPHDFSSSPRTLAYEHLHEVKLKKRAKKKSFVYESGGGGNGGSEDPRLIRIEDTIYLLYTMFDGWDSVRLTLSSISVEDFSARVWNWAKPVYISPPGQVHKNWLLFPEKIRGKYAMLHAISPRVMVDYIDDLSHFDGDTFIYSVHSGSPLWGQREKGIRGVGTPPIKTKDGWLVLYHKNHAGGSQYAIYGMLLDHDDPTRVLAQSDGPLIVPENEHEMGGIKPGIVYTCGACVIDDVLHVYYGAGDTYVCVATFSLADVVRHITHSSRLVVVHRR